MHPSGVFLISLAVSLFRTNYLSHGKFSLAEKEERWVSFSDCILPQNLEYPLENDKKCGTAVPLCRLREEMS